MEKKNVLFYDINSSDANLVQFINRMLYNFIAEPTGVNTNTTDEPFFDPSTIYEDTVTDTTSSSDYNSMIFVGAKPTKAFCDKVKSVKVVIFDDGEIPDDYYFNCMNVVIVYKNQYKTLSRTYWDFMSETVYFNNSIKNSARQTKLLGLVLHYEEYCLMYNNENLRFSSLSAFNFVNNLRDHNLLNLDGFVNEADRIITYQNNNIGITEDALTGLEMTRVISDSNIKQIFTEQGELISGVIKICLPVSEIKCMDRQIRNFLVDNQVIFDKIEFVEYYTINNDLTLSVRAKNIETFVSPFEIKDDAKIIEHIGVANNGKLDAYLTNTYPETLFKNNFDCTKTFTTDMEQFFFE